jgi:outer membrane biosynthesis protein TonB
MQFRSATAISGGLHALVLLWAMISFSGHRLEATPVDSLPVDLISDTQFSQITKGIKDAPKPVDKPKPMVEKTGKTITAEEIVAKLTPKKEIKPTIDKPQEPKPDPIAEKIKKEEKVEKQTEKIKKEEKVEKLAEKPKPLPPKKPEPKKVERQQPKFNPDKIAALLDKRDPTRHMITGAELNTTPTLGTAMGNAAQLSQSEIEALRARLMALWNPPVGIQNPDDLIIRIRIRLGRDGRLSAPPVVLTHGTGQVFDSARDSAVRAVFQGQPFDMLRPEHYDTWKDIEVTFDPKDMFGG